MLGISSAVFFATKDTEISDLTITFLCENLCPLWLKNFIFNRRIYKNTASAFSQT